MGTYSIKDLEKLSQVKAHTIRIWEKRYGLLEPARTGTNIRYYSDDDLRRLLNISLLNDNGFKISKIADLSNAQIHDAVRALEEKSTGLSDQVESLIRAMIELDESHFEKVLGNCVLRMGFEETMLQVIQPFMQRVGILWRISAVKPGQEHFISNLVRQKVITAIDSLAPGNRADPRTFLLALPEGELHEIGLLFAHYLVRKAGHRSIYLGQSVPFGDLEAVIQYRPVDVLVTGFVGGRPTEQIHTYIKRLHQHFPDLGILYFGPKVADGSATTKHLADLLAFRAEVA